MPINRNAAMYESAPLVTVIIAVFNGAKTLQRCITSVARQAYPNKELIIMDGGSTDGTVEMLESNTDKITYWESEPDRGIYHAWNKALDRARGEWICFLGADDCFSAEDSLATLASGLEPHVDFVFGRIGFVSEEGDVLKLGGAPWSWRRMKRYQAIVHPATLHHRSVFERYGKFSEQYRIAGDYEFLLRIGANVEASYVDNVVIHCGTGGVSRSELRRVFGETRRIQSVHPEIGPYRAWKNYCITSSKVALRRLLYGL